MLFEEVGGNIARISLVKRRRAHVCASTFEHHPMIDNWQTESAVDMTKLHESKIRLHCGHGQSISAIKFASFGTPFGGCGSFRQGTCHAPNSVELIEKVCVVFFLPIFVFTQTNDKQGYTLYSLMISFFIRHALATRIVRWWLRTSILQRTRVLMS